MNAERGMTELLNHAVEGVEPRTALLVSAAGDRGRQLRRRRRLAQAGSATALAAMIAAVAVAAWPSAGTGGPAAGGRLHSPATQTTPAAHSSSTRTHHNHAADTADTATITPQVLLQHTLDLLPGGVTTSTYTGRSLAGWVGAEFRYDDGNGLAQVDVSMGFTQDGIDGGQPACDPSVDGCRVLDDGAHVQVAEGPEYSQGHAPYNATERSVDLVRTDGVEVSLSEWNSTQEKDAPITRPEPPLSFAQLIAIADDPGFSPTVRSSAVTRRAGLFHPHPTVTPRQLARERQAMAQAQAERAAARAERRRAAREHGKLARTPHRHG